MTKAVSPAQSLDDDDEDNGTPPIPAGSKNYITPAGFQRLKDEALHLLDKERPDLVKVVAWAASNGDRSENADYIYGKRRLREIDRRIRFLTKRMEAAEIIDPTAREATDQVFFGATVTVVDEEGKEATYAIVGIDEADVARGRLSWISPLARALLKRREDDEITFKAPGGDQVLEIVSVEYKMLD
jgi:transcription elongation factor GreB